MVTVLTALDRTYFKKLMSSMLQCRTIKIAVAVLACHHREGHDNDIIIAAYAVYSMTLCPHPSHPPLIAPHSVAAGGQGTGMEWWNKVAYSDSYSDYEVQIYCKLSKLLKLLKTNYKYFSAKVGSN